SESGGRADQLDLLGADDTALKQMETMAERAATEQRALREQIQAISGASKKPEIARKLGVDVRDPVAVQSKVNELRTELARWENWPTQPDLVARVKGEDIFAKVRKLMEQQAA